VGVAKNALKQQRFEVIINLQVECLIVLGRPSARFGFSGLFSLLISQMRAYQVRFDEWTEHTT
jgi:hypothetical protein